MPIPTDVVIALIWRSGHLLIGLRPEGKSFPLLWEFPGGKGEPGESHSAALRRECMEELAVDVEVGPLAAGPTWVDEAAGAPPSGLRLYFYHARMQDHGAQPQPLTTLELAWVRPPELLGRPFCPADADLVRQLASGAMLPPDGF